jgi:hypothetical protein
MTARIRSWPQSYDIRISRFSYPLWAHSYCSPERFSEADTPNKASFSVPTMAPLASGSSAFTTSVTLHRNQKPHLNLVCRTSAQSTAMRYCVHCTKSQIDIV